MIRVLLVEDDPVIRDTTCYFLKSQQNFEVVCQLMSLTLCTPTYTERVSAFAKPKLIVWMQERLQLCYCPM